MFIPFKWNLPTFANMLPYSGISNFENWEYNIAEGFFFFLELQELTPKSNLQ